MGAKGALFGSHLDVTGVVVLVLGLRRCWEVLNFSE